MNRRRWMIAVTVALLVLPTSMQAFAWQKIVSFGDSLSDDGNGGYNNFPGSMQPGATGPCSDGPVWLWYLTDSMLEPSDPMLGPGLEGRAISGAQSSGPVSELIGQDIGMKAQIDRYITALGGEEQLYDLAGILFTVWIGGNDFLANAENPFAAIEPAIVRIEESIQRLIDIGAEDILIMNLPDLGLAPAVRDLGEDASYAYTAASAQFNALLHQALCNLRVINRGNQVKLYLADTFRLLQYAVENGEALGYEDVESRCSSVDGPCDTALFYDGIHPTTFTHKYLAALALGQVAEDRVSKEMKKMLRMLNPLNPREPFFDTCFE